MQKEWTVYRGTRVKGFDLYELKIDSDRGEILCLENGDPENQANCSVWVNPPLAVINALSTTIYEHTATAVKKKFRDVVRVKPMK